MAADVTAHPFAQPAVACAILAAGASTRFGRNQNKLLANFRGRPLVQHAIDAACASKAIACVLVLGADAEAVEASAETRRCAIIRNSGWEEGIASSIRCALAHRRTDEATIFLVGDEPFVGAADIDALIDEHALRPKAIVALRAGRVWGTPALFPREDYRALMRLRGDHGAKTYAKQHPDRLRLVAARDPRAFVDIDTRADARKAARTRS